MIQRLKVFISSVQREFAEERQIIYQYLLTDALLGRFFDPFIFEILPATDHQVTKIYLDEVRRCDVFICLLGIEYGFEDEAGVSPTEHEYNEASKLGKSRLAFLTNHEMGQRHEKEQKFIKKIERAVVRKCFTSEIELKTAVYTSLIRYLEEKELIRTGPFDASVCRNATLDDLDLDRIAEFVRIARSKRGFPLSDQADPTRILTHLNLIRENGITNASILLFGKYPQRFIPSSEVKCAQFPGNEVLKPILSYQVYKGDVFQLVNQAIDFLLSRIDAAVGTRQRDVQVSVEYEIPRAVVAEAIVNAIAHRDYASTGSVQIMLFRNRIEVWSPGQLTYQLSLEKLRQPHSSFPLNPLIAEPLYLAGYIERLGTGIPDMIELSKKAGLAEPQFMQEEVFKTIVWRQVTGQATGQVTGQATVQVPNVIRNLVQVVRGEMQRSEIQDILELKHRENFINNYLIPAIEEGYLAMTFPDNPNHPLQKYALTNKGLELSKSLLPVVKMQNKTTGKESLSEIKKGRKKRTTGQATGQAPDEMSTLILAVNGEIQRSELQRLLNIKHRGNFLSNFLSPAIESGLIEMTHPELPNHPAQRYRLTEKGLEMKNNLKKKKESDRIP